MNINYALGATVSNKVKGGRCSWFYIMRLIKMTSMFFLFFITIQGVAGEATLYNKAGMLRFGNEHLTLCFDSITGTWLGLESGVSGNANLIKNVNPLPSMNVEVSGKPVFSENNTFVCKKYTTTRLKDASRLDMVITQGDWEITLGYILWDVGILQRTATYVYLGTKNGLEVRRASLVIPPFAVPGKDAFWFATAEYPPRDHLFNQASSKNFYKFPFWNVNMGGVIARDNMSGLNIVASYYSEEERVESRVEERTGAVVVEDTQFIVDMLRPGLRFTIGSQLLCVLSGSRLDALRALQGFYDLPGLRTKIGIPADAGRSIFYSAHAGGTIDSLFRDTGGFVNFTKLLPSIRKLGINTLWMLPFWYGPVYAPYDYYKLDPKCGTPEELKALTTEAHRLGMRVIGDLIPHGPRDEPGVKPTFDEIHPDWICRDQQGKMMQRWQCHYCDYANPGWQDYMAKNAAYWVRQCGLDGYRVDVAAGYDPNWRPYGENRPSFSSLKGGLELLRKARTACLKENPKTIFLPESDGSNMYSASDYAYPLVFAYLLNKHVLEDDAAIFVRDMSSYLENQTYAFPADAFPIRYLTNHDERRARYLYGPGLHRALLALCAFMKGAPLLYHEEEIGNEDFLTQLYQIRQQYDELSLGSVNYGLTNATPGNVFFITREYNGKRSIVAINFSNQKTTVKFPLPESDSSKLGIYEAVSEKRLDYRSVLEYPIQAYGYAVFVIREQGKLPSAISNVIKPAVSQPGKVQVTREDNLVTVTNQQYTAIIDGAQGGLLREMKGNDGALILRGMKLTEIQKKSSVRHALNITATNAIINVKGNEILASGEAGTADGRFKFRYKVQYFPHDKGIDIDFDLVPLNGAQPTDSEICLNFRFAPTTHWFAQTIEGDLFGRSLRRHPVNHGFVGRYWHETGEVFYDSSLHPMLPGDEIGVIDTVRNIGLSIKSPTNGFFERVSILEDKAADSPAQLGAVAAVTAEFQMYNCKTPVTRKEGEEKHCKFSVQIRQEGNPPKAEGKERCQLNTKARCDAYGPFYRLTGLNTQAEIVRSRGGMLTKLTDAAGRGLSITDARFYTDKGLFNGGADTRGNPYIINANSAEDPEPDTQLLADWNNTESPIELKFRSFLRNHMAHGLGLMYPRVEYGINYVIDPNVTGVRVNCYVCPSFEKKSTSAFVAYRISFSNANEWMVNDGGWKPFPEGSAERVWQSKVAGHFPQSIMLRNKQTGEWTKFSDFVIDGKQVQNLFIVAGKGQCHVFIAFYDQKTDVSLLAKQTTFTVKAGGNK